MGAYFWRVLAIWNNCAAAQTVYAGAMKMLRLWKLSDDANVGLSVKYHIYFHPS